MTKGSIVRLWVDHALIGSGYHLFTVADIGRKWAHLFHVSLLVTIKVPKADFERHAQVMPRTAVSPKRTARILRANVKAAKDYQWRFSEIAADAALAALKEAA
jgi:hypothetical protein